MKNKVLKIRVWDNSERESRITLSRNNDTPAKTYSPTASSEKRIGHVLNVHFNRSFPDARIFCHIIGGITLTIYPFSLMAYQEFYGPLEF